MKQRVFSATIVVTSWFFAAAGVGFSGLERQRADGSLLEKQSWKIIEDALETGDPGEAVTAVEALSISGTEEAYRLLRQALDARRSDVWAVAVRKVVQVSRLHGEALPLDKFKRLLKEGELDVQFPIAEALGQAKDAKAAIAVLAPALESENKYVRLVAFGSMVRLGKRDRTAAIASLRPVLDHRNKEVVKSAFKALGQIDGKEAISLLKRGLQNQDLEVQFEAAVGLSRSGDDSAVDRVRAVVASPDSDKRLRSILALYEYGDPAYLEALEQGLQSDDSDRRWTAISAIYKIVTEGSKPKQEVMSLLRRALDNPSDVVRRRAVNALSEAFKPENVELLKSKLTDRDEWVRVIAAQGLLEHGRLQGNPLAVEVLREALHSPSEGHRKIALEGLAATGSQEFAPLFRKALEDSEDSVVLAAIDGLVQIHDRSSLPGLLEVLKSVDTKFVKEAAAGAIVQLGGSHDAAKLEPLLEKGLDQDRYGYTRIFAAGAIIGLLHS